MQHRTNGKYGENLYAQYGSPGYPQPTARDATTSWYNEVRVYNFSNPGFSMNTGHFTAVVWKNTKELGIATATNRSGATYIVANYSPWGNVMGQFPQNVFPANY